ncbi:hypothetical protein PPO43_13570 [Saprospira sp. CCB-QB6]|uniref:hypothetical protein n=1 Tax=Saprospira sp. CCB-QB6 TaxID=3023936 RepID=UPI00234B9D95|nr:hypothetical protein [Saprospira sp. CCB-QB6]WCL80998.1 hypothetical protein PPO43_13570 [Saprospira sp. CCB-QB6]
MRYLFLLICLCMAFASQAQDLIYKNDGKIIGAKILRTDSSFVYFRHTEPPKQLDSIAQSEVSKVEFDYSQKAFKSSKPFSRNAVSVSIGGTSVLLGISYDRIIGQERNYHFSGRIGIGSLSRQTNINTHLSFNFYLNKVRTQFFEVGAGLAIPLNERNSIDYYNLYLTAPILGYRIQRYEGFFFRVYVSGLYMRRPASANSWISDVLYIPTIGLDLGYSF